MPGNGIGPCEMCENGLADHFPTIDGETVDLCVSCYRLFRKSGRIEGPELSA